MNSNRAKNFGEKAFHQKPLTNSLSNTPKRATKVGILEANRPDRLEVMSKSHPHAFDPNFKLKSTWKTPRQWCILPTGNSAHEKLQDSDVSSLIAHVSVSFFSCHV